MSGQKFQFLVRVNPTMRARRRTGRRALAQLAVCTPGQGRDPGARSAKAGRWRVSQAEARGAQLGGTLTGGRFPGRQRPREEDEPREEGGEASGTPGDAPGGPGDSNHRDDRLAARPACLFHPARTPRGRLPRRGRTTSADGSCPVSNNTRTKA